MRKQPQNRIKWCHDTINPDPGECRFLGCELRKIDDKNRCYAYGQGLRFGRSGEFTREYAEKQFKKVENIPKSIVFVGSMNELGMLDTEDLQFVVNQCSKFPHLFIFLTKLPIAYKHIEIPSNVMIGASVTSDKYLSRIETLLECVPETKKCVSFEPLLGEMTPWKLRYLLKDIYMIMIGALSHNNRPILKYYPKLSWVDEIIWTYKSVNRKGKVWMKENLSIQEGVRF